MESIDNLLLSIGRMVDRHRTIFDPSLLGDPLACQIEWSPLVRGGTNFRTRALRSVSPHRVEVRPTLGAWLFGGAFAGVAMVACLLVLRSGRDSGPFDSETYIPLLFGIPFGAIAWWSLRTMTVRHVFDRREGYWWRGSSSPSQDKSLVQRGKAGALSEIHAIQLVTESISGTSKGSHDSTELNLVLHDGSRRPVVDHGGGGIVDDAEKLAAFLGVPLWNQRAAHRPFDPAIDQATVRRTSKQHLRR